MKRSSLLHFYSPSHLPLMVVFFISLIPSICYGGIDNIKVNSDFIYVNGNFQCASGFVQWKAVSSGIQLTTLCVSDKELKLACPLVDSPLCDTGKLKSGDFLVSFYKRTKSFGFWGAWKADESWPLTINASGSQASSPIVFDIRSTDYLLSYMVGSQTTVNTLRCYGDTYDFQNLTWGYVNFSVSYMGNEGDAATPIGTCTIGDTPEHYIRGSTTLNDPVTLVPGNVIFLQVLNASPQLNKGSLSIGYE